MKSVILVTLGPPGLFGPEGQPLQVGKLPLVLLAYLCVEGRPLSRDHLGSLLWPRSDRARQRHNLRQAVLRLRKAAGADLLEGNGTLSVRPGSIRFDHVEFLEAIERGDAGAAAEMWEGTFLEGVRRPESWELEDWIDQQRSRLEKTLGAAVVAEAKGRLGRGEFGEALGLLEPARQRLPYSEEMGALLVVALAGAGRVAEAEGVMGTLDVDPSDPLVAEMVEAVSQAHARELEPPPTWRDDGSVSSMADSPSAGPSSADPASAADDKSTAGEEQAESSSSEAASQDSGSTGEIESGEKDRGARWLRVGHLSLAAAAVAIVLLVASVTKESSPTAAEIASSQSGYALMVCAAWANNETYQPFRMGFDGNDRHRIATDRICMALWSDEAEAVYGVLQDSDSLLVKVTPNPANPIAEWDVAPLPAAGHLRATRLKSAAPVKGPGGLLLFSAEDTLGNRDVYALEPSTDQLRRLTTSEADDRLPSIDPDGRTVVFTSYRTGGGDLYRMNLDGTGLERLTNHPLQDSRPQVRGDSVLFVRGWGEEDEDGNMELMLLDLRTGAETPLTENHWNDLDPRWSPDGTHICWLSEKEGHYASDVEVMELATGKRWNLSDSPLRETACRWTPDGRGIFYLAFDSESSEIVLKPFRGGDAFNMTKYRGEEGVIALMEIPPSLRIR